MGNNHKESQRRHSEGLEKILSSPELVGIEGIDLKKKELTLKNKRETWEIDLIIFYQNNSYFIEYKGKAHPNNEKKARKQLEIIKRNISYLDQKYVKENQHYLYIAGDIQSPNRRIIELVFRN